MGGRENSLMDEQIPRYSHLLDEETGELHRSTTPGVRVYHFGTVWPFGIGSKPIVAELGWRSLILVAQNVHARRALAIFRRLYGPEYTFYFAAAKSKYELLPQRRLSSEPRFLLTWELPSFLLAKIRGWA